MPKKLSHEHAAAAMRECGAEPLEQYPGANKRWHCRCMKCGSDIWPRYSGVVNGGKGPCKPCGDRKISQSLTIPHDKAVAFMLERDFQPNVPYPGALKPWPGVCLKCGQPGSPTYDNVQHGQGPCAYCAGRKLDEAIAVGKMLAADFQPNGPYPGSNNVPWEGVCLKCGQPGSPLYTSIARGAGACGNCAEYGYKSSKTGYFYFVAGKDWLKGGITNSPNTRLPKHKRQGLTQVLHLWEYTDGSIPQILEDLWKEHLTTLPDTDRPEKYELKDGFTEAVRRTAPLEEWIQQVFVPLADQLQLEVAA